VIFRLNCEWAKKRSSPLFLCPFLPEAVSRGLKMLHPHSSIAFFEVFYISILVEYGVSIKEEAGSLC
jgi:hypothetical protein